ncbi:MAG: beta-ketoacyl-[acyl-carrier-protein] synthase family protein [Clostridia bacterium]|nr:beta-ketoacyl-[acyl-carrier-protein] synthase family protein [Clostridia bacterium]
MVGLGGSVRNSGGRRRVFITGVGIVSPLGGDRESTWEALLAGRSGVGPLDRFPSEGYGVRIAAQVRDPAAEAVGEDPELARYNRFIRFAARAAREALADAEARGARPPAPERSGLFLGTGLGGIETLGRGVAQRLGAEADFDEMEILRTFPAVTALRFLAGRHGLRGPAASFSSACASSAHGLGEALRALRRGEADRLLVVGTEAAIVPLAVAGFANMRALSTRNEEPWRASRPFDEERDGFVIGEGAAALVLDGEEQLYDARPYAELAGYGSSEDAFHPTLPDPEGRGAEEAMRRALADAGLAPERIGYINAHATGTPAGDEAEARAIAAIFGRYTGDDGRAPRVGATKAQTGHLLGAAGTLEAALTALGLERGVLPGTATLERPQPELGIRLFRDPVAARPEAALSNSFGFGGQNVTLVLVAAEGNGGPGA